MFPRIACVVVASCAFAATAVHADVSDALEVDIRLHVAPSIAARHITDRLKTETESIWAPYGIKLEWMDTEGVNLAAHGVCVDASIERRFEQRDRLEWPAPLGRAVVDADTPTWRPIHVSFDATERVLAGRTTGRLPSAAIVLDRELARALGRVLAHEIGHVLLGGADHERTGLMRATFRGDELAGADRTPFRLTPHGVDRLAGRLRTLNGGSE